ncbi:MAG: hypothetical protein IT584_03000 [Chlamydiae bacterium]|nr:hypothetical protein [Chlamydiota bacterium]
MSLEDKDSPALENIQCVLICSADISSHQEEIDNIKKAAFGSISPDCFREFSSANLIKQSVSIVRKNRDETYSVKEIPERIFYLTLVSKKDKHASANK